MGDTPSALRIVSLLPAATEMACALGLVDQLVGVSHECDYPPAVKTKPILLRSALPVESLSLAEIDAAVSERLRNGESLYELDEILLRQIEPDLVLTQDLCQVCAASSRDVMPVLASLPKQPRILQFSPKSLGSIFDNLKTLAMETGRTTEADQLIADGRGRIASIAAVVRALPRRPRVFCMEWIDPMYCSGHWVPEMVELAGGIDMLSRKGSHSIRTSWESVLEWAPEILVIMPCGFGLEDIVKQAAALTSLPHWVDLPAVRADRVYAVDANSYFARPGPRVVTGVELLAHIIHPEKFLWAGNETAFAPLKTKACGDCGALLS